MEPNVAEMRYNRGVAYVAKGDLDRGIADLTAAIRINLVLAEAYCGRPLGYVGKGDKAKAAADFAQARSLGYTPK